MPIPVDLPADAREVVVVIGITNGYVEALANANGRQRPRCWSGGNLEDRQRNVTSCLIATSYAPSGPLGNLQTLIPNYPSTLHSFHKVTADALVHQA